MKMTDLILHRSYANRKLRKETETIKKELYEHKVLYEAECKKIDAEIKKEEEQFVAVLEEKQMAFKEIIANSDYHYSDISKKIEEYVSIFYKRQLIADINKKRFILVKQYEKYTRALEEKKSLLVDIEQAYLDRETILSGKADVSDIIDTIMLSNYSTYVAPNMNARSLLKTLKTLRYTSDNVLIISINRLQRLVEERADYLAEIDYIDWMKDQIENEISTIESRVEQNQQKVSKLSREMRKSKKRKEKIDIELQTMWNDIIIEYGRDYESRIERAKKEQEELRTAAKQKREEAHQKKEEIDRCYRWHSFDNLDRLKDEKGSLFKEADALRTEADEFETKISDLIELKKKANRELISFLRKHEVRIMSKRADK